MVPGYKSIESLSKALRKRFGAELVRFDSFGPANDYLGWRMVACPRFTFGASTLAGELPFEVYDFEVHIDDDSLEQGEIAFIADGDLSKKEVLDVVRDFVEGQRA